MLQDLQACRKRPAPKAFCTSASQVRVSGCNGASKSSGIERVFWAEVSFRPKDGDPGGYHMASYMLAIL
uniref:Uncharacterized protein n=1 Tax=Romanomermis culicivorax TaxID=13658 RepID=A0A915L020_ROMCU